MQRDYPDPKSWTEFYTAIVAVVKLQSVTVGFTWSLQFLCIYLTHTHRQRKKEREELEINDRVKT